MYMSLWLISMYSTSLQLIFREYKKNLLTMESRTHIDPGQNVPLNR